MVCHQHAEGLAWRAREGFANELHLLLVDPPVLECEGTSGVHAQHGHPGQLDERAQGVVDEAAVARERREEATQHVVERHVVITGNWHASRNCSVRARCVKSPLMTTRSGFNLSTSPRTASTRRSSWAPKWRSERWTIRGMVTRRRTHRARQ